MIDRDLSQRSGLVIEDLLQSRVAADTGGVNRTIPTRYAVVNKVGKVWLGIMCVWAGNAQAGIIRCRNTVTHKHAVGMK